MVDEEADLAFLTHGSIFAQFNEIEDVQTDLLRPGINIGPERPDHNWTAPSAPVHTWR